MKAIEVYNLTREYNTLRVVDQIRFSVEPGEIFGLLGSDGAGKTTTIKMLTGLLRPSSGHAKVAGYDILHQREKLQARIGVVFEDQNVYGRLSAWDNLWFAAQLYGVAKARIDQVLQDVGMTDHANEKAKKFSNGMKQRLVIARALLPTPVVIFLDEPTKGLDPGMSRTIHHILLELVQQGVTILLASHDLEEIDRLANRVAILERGRILAMDTPMNLKFTYGGEGASLKDVFFELTGDALHD